MTREIIITPVLNGWLCKVGCTSVVFNKRSDLLDELDKYLKDPDGTEKLYLANAVNRLDCTLPAPPPATQDCAGMQPQAMRSEPTQASIHSIAPERARR